MAEGAAPDPVLAKLHTMRDPDDAVAAPSEAAKPTKKTPSKQAAASTPGPQSTKRGGSGMDPDDVATAITAGIEAALTPLVSKIDDLDKQIKKQKKDTNKAKKGKAATSEEEADADFIAEAARKAFIKEKERQRKDHRKQLAEAASAGAIVAAGGQADLPLRVDPDGTINLPASAVHDTEGKKPYSDEEVVNYYRVNGKVPDDWEETLDQYKRVDPRLKDIDKEKGKRWWGRS